MQLGSLTETPEAAGASLANWRAYYIFYHADRDRLLRDLARPLVAELLRGGAIDRFFFVRYGLGGPHVRLRWRLSGPEAEAEAALARRAEAFFASWPSPEPLAEEGIRNTNRSIMQMDPLAGPEDDVVYPDNTWRRFPMQLEAERYGGLERLPASLDLFTVSSARVLRLLAEREEAAAGWTRPAMLRLILQLAWSFASNDPDAFQELAGYGVRFMGDRFGPCIEQGDAAFERKSAQLAGMVRREIEALASAAEADDLVAAGSRVAAGLAGLPAEQAWYLGASHIHMTANRLGLSNADEVYLSRMLWRAVEALRSESSPEWNGLWKTRREPSAGDPVPHALAALAGEV